nr:hypothetical protein SHINE37_43951 [Rhizobiaceae bacterium]
MKSTATCGKLTDHILLQNACGQRFCARARFGRERAGHPNRPALRRQAMQIRPSKNAGNRLYDGQRRAHGPH